MNQSVIQLIQPKKISTKLFIISLESEFGLIQLNFGLNANKG